MVVSKDDDFRELHIVRRVPARLLLVTCGNLSTRGLIALVDQHNAALSVAVATYSFIELHRSGVFVHDPA